MWKKIALIIVLLPFVLSAQSKSGKLIIEKKSTYDLNILGSIEVDTLVLEDSSRIILKKGTENVIRANVVEIGKHILIHGRGAHGAYGKNGLKGKNAIGPCRHGASAKNGARGQDGQAGASLYFYLEKIIVNGNLIIDLAGGNGGDGGDGGEGGGGSPGTVHCAGGNGGKGGDAGSGGNGGEGGSLTIAGSEVGLIKALIGSRIAINTLGGNFGYAGMNGPGGSPGIGPSKSQGKSGLAGRGAGKGIAGSNGIIHFEQQYPDGKAVALQRDPGWQSNR